MKSVPSPANGEPTGPASPPASPAEELRASDETVDGGSTDDPDDEHATADRIGRYLVLRRLGHGGMGVVLEAFDPELDRKVALKLLHPERARGASRLRLLREAQALARLSHPNVVQVYDVGVDGEQVFMAMELVRGRTISAWLHEQRRPWPEIVARFVDAGRGLQAAHEAGLVHRDFKPHNVLVGDDGRVRVADFGLAGAEGPPVSSPAGEGPATTSYLATPLTATGAVLGTPRYMAPEQHAGLEVGPAADQFAFCVALYEAVIGSHPFEGELPLSLVANVVEGRVVAPPEAARVPRWLSAAIHRGLAHAPAERHPDMASLLRVLEREPLARRRRAAVAGLALVLALGGGAVAWLGSTAAAPCTGGAAALAEVWSDPQRDAVTTALAAGGAEASAAIVVRTLDGFGEQWADSHRAVCLEHRDEAMSTETFETAMGCLQRGRAALAGVVETVASGEPGVVAAAAGAAASLPAPSACRDRERLVLDLRPPTDPGQARAAADLRERLARAEAVHDAGAMPRALEELAALEREADRLGHVPLLAERSLVAGRLAMDRNDWPLARRELSEALVQSLTSRADLVAAEAAVRRLFVEAMLAAPGERTSEDEAVAGALVERVGAPRGLAALLANNVGVVRVLGGAREEAALAFAQALAHADAADDVDPVDHCGYVLNVARATADPVERDALFVRAAALAETWLGPEHERTLEVAQLRARHTVEPAEAIALMTPTCERMRARRPVEWHRCLCHYRLAELHELVKNDAAARGAMAEAVACLDEATRTEDRDLPGLTLLEVEGHLALLRGDHERALAYLDEVEAGLRPRIELPWVALELANVALLRARSLHALSRGTEAIEPLRSAIATYDAEIRISEERAPRERRERAVQLLAELEAQRRSSIPSSSSQR